MQELERELMVAEQALPRDTFRQQIRKIRGYDDNIRRTDVVSESHMLIVCHASNSGMASEHDVRIIQPC